MIQLMKLDGEKTRTLAVAQHSSSILESASLGFCTAWHNSHNVRNLLDSIKFQKLSAAKQQKLRNVVERKKGVE